MRRFAKKADLLDQGAVRGFGEDGPRLLPVARARMDHHRHIDIVEMALGDKLRYAEHDLDFAPGDARNALLDIDELLGRHGEKDDLAGEVLGGLCVAEADRGTQHAGDLSIVAAAVRRPCRRISERMFRGAQAVELADEGEPWSWGAAGESALDTGKGEAGARLEPQCRHALRHEGSGFHLVEAGLRVAQDRFAEIDDRVGMAINRVADRALQFILAAHFISCSRDFRPASSVRDREPGGCFQRLTVRPRKQLDARPHGYALTCWLDQLGGQYASIRLRRNDQRSTV